MTVEELMNNEAFLKELSDTPSAAAAVELFKARGIEVTEEDLEAWRVEVIKAAHEELGEEELADVAGGLRLKRPIPTLLPIPIIPRIPLPKVW